MTISFSGAMRTLLFTALVSVFSGCNAQTGSETSGTYKNIGNEEARVLIAETPDLQIVDVRQNAEVARGMIDGAVQMDISKPAFNQQIASLDKSKPVLVYCASGGRSRTAMEILQENGFQTVYNLKTGYEGWK